MLSVSAPTLRVRTSGRLKTAGFAVILHFLAKTARKRARCIVSMSTCTLRSCLGSRDLCFQGCQRRTHASASRATTSCSRWRDQLGDLPTPSQM
jgi:hypothetical protein